MKVIIVGGVAGGATAAARLRRIDEKAEIIIYERSGFISYANCGLPYFIGDVIQDPSELTMQTPESFFSRFGVTVNIKHEVISIDQKAKTVTVKDLRTNHIFEDSYDKLLLAPGAKPVVPNLPGIDSKRLFTLRTVEDTLRIKKYIQEHSPKSVILAGGGFISVELAENLKALGMDVTIVQRGNQLLNPYDADMAAFIHAEMRKQGVHLALEQSVEGFEEIKHGIEVLLKDSKPLVADMAILAIGVAPDSSLAKDAGLELGVKNSILVNEYLETSAPDIYAVGDAIQVTHRVTKEGTLVSLAGPANKQGRIVADNISGRMRPYKGAQGSSILKIFDLTAASTGINEGTATRLGLNFDKVILSPMNQAGYYPGGRIMTMKVLYEKETFRLLGAQIVGYNGVDKRIDVLATAIFAGLTGPELKDLDLAYAPPYSTAKDPINLAGYLMDNIQSGSLTQYHLEKLVSLPKDGSVTLLDTRTSYEYKRGHVDGYINIPVDQLRERLSEIPEGKPVYIICQSGLRSYVAHSILRGYGFETYNFSGGYRFYETVVREKVMVEAARACGVDCL